MGRTISILSAALVALTLTLLMSPQSLAVGRFHVFDVRKSLPMKNNEPVVRDYYINAGTRDGLKPNMVVNIVRREPMRDLYNDIQEDLVVNVGRLKLIVVQKTLSIGRLVSARTPVEGPILEHSAVMTGDRVDVGSATFEDEQGKKGSLSEENKEPMRAAPSLPPPKPPKPQAAKIPQPVKVPQPSESGVAAKESSSAPQPEDSSLYEEDEATVLPQ